MLAAFDTQRAVLGALILRELQSRFGRDNIGFFWLIGEPLMLAAAISSLHYMTNGGVRQAGIAPYPFTLLGYCLFMLFRNNFNRSEATVLNSKTLLYHKMVTPLDLLIVQTVVEFIGVCGAFAVLMTIGIAAGIADLPARPLFLIGAALLMAWLSFALTLIVATYASTHHLISRLVHPTSYFMLPASGAFVTMNFLPPWLRPYMAWNPMMTICEIGRYGQFQTASPDYMYPLFAIAVCTGLTYWGMVVIRGLRQYIHVG